MKDANIEILFSKLDQAITLLRDNLKTTNLSALVETFDNLEHGDVKVESGAPTPDVVESLKQVYAEMKYDELDLKVKQNLFKLSLIKAIKEDKRDYNQQITPPAISTVIGLMLKKLVPDLADKIILDPAVGTGELLFNIIDQLQLSKDKRPGLVGLDNDDEFLDVADLNAQLQQLDVELVHQDSLEDWLGDKPDIVISDLPIGYYPNDTNAKNFDLAEKEGHSLAHQLFVEQIVRNLSADGIAFLVVPAVLLQGVNATNFVQWLTKKVYLQAIIDLPSDMFIEEQMQKDILVFQKHGESSHQAKDILLAKLGSLLKKESLVEFNYKLNEWYNNNLE